MTSSPSKLTLAFINKRPEAAARVLESLPVEDAAAFIEAIPTRYAIKILANINSTLTVAIVQRLPVATATAALRDVEFVVASAVLRRIPRELRITILGELPDRRRREFESVMKFASDSVGANMNTAVVTVSKNETVADALKRVKEDRDGDSNSVYVIDGEHKLLGSVRLSILARQPVKTVMIDLLDESCTPVAARSRISEITDLVAWNQHNQLPVVSRRGELMGALYKSGVLSIAHEGGLGMAADPPSIAESVLRMMVGSARAASTASQHASAGESDER